MFAAIRSARLGLVVAAVCTAAACVHAPADKNLRGPAHEPTGVTAPSNATPPAQDSATYPGDLVPPAAQGESRGQSTLFEAALAEESFPVVGLTPPQFADLFDRVRAGFKLDEVEKRAVELELNWYAGNPEYLERAFGRAELYLHHIVSEVEARDMPLELALLPIVESAFEPFAYSRARAAGLWQFIPGTGSRFGLKQNWWYDGRRDVVESTRAALDYLQYLHDEFDGDWLLAVAGYNCGEAAVARAIAANRRAGKPTDFWSLRLPKETRAYVPKLLAMKRLVADPESHGIGFSMIANQPYFTRVETYGQIDLKLAAEIAGITYEELYELNPAFHRWATDPAGPHFLLLPIEGAADVFLQNIGQLTPEQRIGATLYTVQQNDSVSSIAKRFNTTINVIRELNELPSGPLVIGSELRVPAAVVALPPKVARAAARVDGRDRTRPHVHVVRRGDSLWRIAKRHGMNVNTLATMNGMQPTDTLRAGQKLKLIGESSAKTSKASTGTTIASSGDGRDVTYTVRRGDTLSAIARLFQVTVAQLVSWNDISARSPIKPGQKLMIRLAGSRS